MMRELGTWTGPGPLSETCGPEAFPLTWTLIGHPGTGILLNDTLIMCSHASAGTKETANLKFHKSLEKFHDFTLSFTNLLCIALRMDLSWNIVTLRRDCNFKISFSSIASVNGKLHWSTYRSFCHCTDRNFLGIV